MRKRLLATGMSVTVALSLGAFGVTGVALAGEDAPPPETVTVTTPAPAPETVSVPSPPETVTVTTPAPAPESSSGTAGESGGGGGSSSGSGKTKTVVKTRYVPRTVYKDIDTGTVPQGGVQAGSGGTAATNWTPALMALALAALAFALTSGGVALRRRASER